jgi:hypothetical protein
MAEPLLGVVHELLVSLCQRPVAVHEPVPLSTSSFKSELVLARAGSKLSKPFVLIKI